MSFGFKLILYCFMNSSTADRFLKVVVGSILSHPKRAFLNVVSEQFLKASISISFGIKINGKIVNFL